MTLPPDKDQPFLKFFKQKMLNKLKKTYSPIFDDINLKSTNNDWINSINNFDEFNNKTTNYLKFKELDCNLNKKFDPSQHTINEPIILRGFYKDTHAFNKWNKDNLADKFGKHKTTVEFYQGYIDFFNNDVSIEKKYNISQFLEKMDKETELLYIGEQSLSDFKKNSLYRDNDNPRIQNKPYDSVIFLGNRNAGSHTHLHLAPLDYILNQVIGTKTMYFFELNDNIDQNIGISSPFNQHRKFIFDYNKFESFNLRFINHQKLKIYKVQLYPGDSIFIPPWWWHNAVCNDFSLSITDKYDRDNNSFFYKYPNLFYNEFVLRVLKPDVAQEVLLYINDNVLPIYSVDNSKSNKLYEQYLITIFTILIYILYLSFFTFILYIILKYQNIHIPIHYLIPLTFFLDYTEIPFTLFYNIKSLFTI